MNAKGVLAVTLFAVCLATATLDVAQPSNFDWVATPVVSGLPVLISVWTAPCPTVTVILKIGSQEISTTVGVPGVATINVPATCSGQQYTLQIRCPTERTSQVGVVM